MLDTSHLHPMIVHFPIALILVGFLFELASLFIKKELFSTVAFYLLILGTLGIAAAYLSGDLAGEGISETGALKTALETHEHAAGLALWIIISASVIRIAYILLKDKIKFLRWVSFVLFAVGVFAVARTGYYGGQLVYKHAAGVQINLGMGTSDGNTDETEKKTDND